MNLDNLEVLVLMADQVNGESVALLDYLEREENVDQMAPQVGDIANFFHN